jgi:hypothetical protein
MQVQHHHNENKHNKGDETGNTALLHQQIEHSATKETSRKHRHSATKKTRGRTMQPQI